jgi:hypothetical protein
MSWGKNFNPLNTANFYVFYTIMVDFYLKNLPGSMEVYKYYSG